MPQKNNLIKRYADILHLYFSGYLQKLPKNEFNRFAPNSLKRRLYTLLAMLKKRYGQLRLPTVSNEDQALLHNKIWLFVISQNNVDATEFLSKNLSNTVLVTDKRRVFKNAKRYCFVNLRYQIIHFYKFPLLLFGLFRDGLITHFIFSSIQN